MLSKEIWIFTEYTDNEVRSVTLESLSEARKLAKQLDAKTCALLFGSNMRKHLNVLKGYGAEKVYFLDEEVFSRYSLDLYLSALKRLIKQYRPLVLIFGATPHGRELAPRVAARIKVPCITEVKRIWSDGEHLMIAKSCYEDKVYQNFELGFEQPTIITILPGDMDSEKTKVLNEIQIVEEHMSFECLMSRTRYIKSLKGDPKQIRIEEADLIVAVGRGIGKDFADVADLAEILGASIGGTRPMVDEGMISFDRQIGITGKSVEPRLLLACGISGAREFMAGIEKAHLTIAINTNSKAPIFRKADLGVHGNVNEIVPVLVEKLRRKKSDKQ